MSARIDNFGSKRTGSIVSSAVILIEKECLPATGANKEIQITVTI